MCRPGHRISDSRLPEVRLGHQRNSEKSHPANIIRVSSVRDVKRPGWLFAKICLVIRLAISLGNNGLVNLLQNAR